VVLEDGEPGGADVGHRRPGTGVLVLCDPGTRDEGAVEVAAGVDGGLEVEVDRALRRGAHGLDVARGLGAQALDHGVDERLLAPEVVEQSALGDAGLGGHGVEGRRAASRRHDQLFERVEQAVASAAVVGHGRQPSDSAHRAAGPSAIRACRSV